MGAAASIGTRSLNLPAPDSLGQWPASQTTYGTGDFGGQKTSGSIDPDAINKQFRSKAEADAGAFLGNLMKTGVGGAMEELGIGDWLPDFTQTPLMRSIAGGLEAFKGPLQGALEGKLGIQQPGWQPGMPVKALTEGGGDTTSGGGGGLPLFGLPNIDSPPSPQPQHHDLADNQTLVARRAKPGNRRLGFGQIVTRVGFKQRLDQNAGCPPAVSVIAG